MSMKYCVVVMDGASGLPLPERGNKTCLELASKPNLDAMAREGTVGLVRTVPQGMEPSSACACMSILGYNPRTYYHGRAIIEAISMGVPVAEGEVVFRCNLVAVRDGKMLDYSSGHISTGEARELIATLNERLGNEEVQFYPGVGYRHICKLRGEGSLQAICTPPHDIHGRPIVESLPRGAGSRQLLDIMERSIAILKDHPVNIKRRERGETPATMLWLFWGSKKVPAMPSFKEIYGLEGAMTSGVDLLKGLALMMRIDVLNIPGVTDGPDNDYRAQVTGALEALRTHDLVVVHVESPDEAAHGGHTEHKIKAIEEIDREMMGRIRGWRGEPLRLLVMPDHSTPIQLRTHSEEPVPFLLWGNGFLPNGAKIFSEKETKSTGFFIDDGYNIMNNLIGRTKTELEVKEWQ